MTETQKRELDAWIAKNLFRWEIQECKKGYGIQYFDGIGKGEEEEEIPKYTTDPAAAMEKIAYQSKFVPILLAG